MTVVVPVVVPLVSRSRSESLLGAINTRSVLPLGEAYSENIITDLFFLITVLLFPHYARCLFVPIILKIMPA